MQRRVQDLMLGASVKDPPLLLRCHLLMEKYPGYTVTSLLAEPAEVFEGLWAIRAAEVAVSNAKRKP